MSSIIFVRSLNTETVFHTFNVLKGFELQSAAVDLRLNNSDRSLVEFLYITLCVAKISTNKK